MPRLSSLPDRLSSVAPRLDGQLVAGKSAPVTRDDAKPWRKWYGRKAWKDLKRMVMARDQGVCVQTGVPLIGVAPAPNSPVVDHIIEHKGDWDLFHDPDNLQLVSKQYHDTEKQRIERARHA